MKVPLSRRGALLLLAFASPTFRSDSSVDAFSVSRTPSTTTRAPPLSSLRAPDLPPPPPFDSPVARLRSACLAWVVVVVVASTRVVPAAWALTEEQALVDDVWREVTRQYVDRTYNGLGLEGWREERSKAVRRATGVGPDEEGRREVYGAIRTMLSALGDPYTRFLTPEQFDTLTAFAREGGAGGGGVGVRLAADPADGRVVVLRTAPNGPAARGGVLPGDALVSVDGASVDGATADVVAAQCRGATGTSVTLAVRRGDGDSVREITVVRTELPRETVESSSFRTSDDRAVLVVRVPSFNQNTAADVAAALRRSRRGGRADAVVLDLRGNPGGYAPAGVDVAKLFLPPRARIMSEIDASGRAAIYVNDGVGEDVDADTPLYALVDERTASASEILTAALRDNQRATVVSASDRTFGKGRVQNVQGPLADGSGLAVTKARYETPNGRDVHKVGIRPDVLVPKDTCGPADAPANCLQGVL